jgi:hypothetical protein
VAQCPQKVGHPWEPVRPESFFTVEAQQQGIARLREAEDLVDFG